jgi:hypothetical protein
VPVIFALGVVTGGLAVNHWWWLLAGALVWAGAVAFIAGGLGYATRNPWLGDDLGHYWTTTEGSQAVTGTTQARPGASERKGHP